MRKNQGLLLAFSLMLLTQFNMPAVSKGEEPLELIEGELDEGSDQSPENESGGEDGSVNDNSNGGEETGGDNSGGDETGGDGNDDSSGSEGSGDDMNNDSSGGEEAGGDGNDDSGSEGSGGEDAGQDDSGSESSQVTGDGDAAGGDSKEDKGSSSPQTDAPTGNSTSGSDTSEKNKDNASAVNSEKKSDNAVSGQTGTAGSGEQKIDKEQSLEDEVEIIEGEKETEKENPQKNNPEQNEIEVEAHCDYLAETDSFTLSVLVYPGDLELNLVLTPAANVDDETYQESLDVLKQIAYELTTSCIDGDVYCRLEADHFALLLPQDRFSEEAYNTASGRIRIADDLSYKITVLFGVYKIDPSDSASIPVMCDRCLFAIQASEQNDPRVVRYFDVNMRLDAVWSQQMMKDLQAGLDEEEFRLYIQPQVAVDGSVSGGEVLVRWQHPRDGLIQPGRFVPVLERNGSITKLDYYVWEHTCMVLKRWRDQGYADAYLSVNISPIDFYYYDIYTIFTGLVREYNIEPGNLRLEITETAVIKNSEAAFDILERVREAGFIVEMDDFGSGYSSLNMLKDLPVDTLKVDMIFLQQSKNEERAQRIIHSIINMAKDLDLEVVTEGVETREQALMLRDMKTDFYQGYYFAKPMPLAEFEEKWLGNTASAWPEDPE